jgi:hypothetical protein
MVLTISFNLDNFSSTEEIFLFTVNHLPFPPKAINSQLSFKGGYDDFKFEEVRELFKTNNDIRFQIAEDVYPLGDEINSVLYKREPIKNLQYLIFTFDNLNEHWLKHLLTDAHKIGFFMAFYKDEFKSLWQNEIFINHYTQMGKPYNHLNLKMHWHPILSPTLNEEIIDIFQNPGHSIMTYSTWLMAAPEMWFGKNAWQYFEKQNLKNYTKALLVNEIEQDLVHVKLFEADETDYERKEILDLQCDFRSYSGMDQIEKQLEIIANERSKANGADGIAIQTIIVE